MNVVLFIMFFIPLNLILLINVAPCSYKVLGPYISSVVSGFIFLYKKVLYKLSLLLL